MKNRYWKAAGIAALAVMGAAALVVLFLTVGRQLWTHTSYRIEWETEVGNDASTLFSELGGSLLVIGRDSVTCMSAGGSRRWVEPCSMSDPVPVKKGDTCLIYDRSGKSFLICRESGVSGSGTAQGMITGGDVAENGTCVLRTEENTASLLSFCRSSGEALKIQIRSPLADTGYPLAFGLSPGGQQLAVSYYYIADGQGHCKVVFYDFREGEEADRRVGEFDFASENIFVPKLSYPRNDLAYAVTDEGITVFDVASRTQIVRKDIHVEGDILQVFTDEEHIGLLIYNGGYYLNIYSVDGKLIQQLPQSTAFEHYFFQSGCVGMYTENHCRIISFSGRLRFDMDLINPVRAFLPLGGFGSNYLVTMDELQRIRLK